MKRMKNGADICIDGVNPLVEVIILFLILLKQEFWPDFYVWVDCMQNGCATILQGEKNNTMYIKMIKDSRVISFLESDALKTSIF